MFDYAFAHYNTIDLLGKKDLGKYRVDSGKDEYVKVIPKESATSLRKKGEDGGKIKYDVNINSLKAPLKKGDVIGFLVIKEDGNEIKKVPLTVSKSILKINFIELLFRNVKDMVIGNISIN